MPRDLGDLAVSIHGTIKALPEAERRAVRRAALVTKKIILTETAKAVGPDLRMSGVGRKGASLRVKAEPFRKDREGTTWAVRAVGKAWPLIERDTSPHRIPKKRKWGRKRYAVVDGHPYAYANHPGTTGKRPFQKGWRKASKETPKIFQKEVIRTIRKAW